MVLILSLRIQMFHNIVDIHVQLSSSTPQRRVTASSSNDAAEMSVAVWFLTSVACVAHVLQYQLALKRFGLVLSI